MNSTRHPIRKALIRTQGGLIFYPQSSHFLESISQVLSQSWQQRCTHDHICIQALLPIKNMHKVSGLDYQVFPGVQSFGFINTRRGFKFLLCSRCSRSLYLVCWFQFIIQFREPWSREERQVATCKSPWQLLYCFVASSHLTSSAISARSRRVATNLTKFLALLFSLVYRRRPAKAQRTREKF